MEKGGVQAANEESKRQLTGTACQRREKKAMVPRPLHNNLHKGRGVESYISSCRQLSQMGRGGNQKEEEGIAMNTIKGKNGRWPFLVGHRNEIARSGEKE